MYGSTRHVHTPPPDTQITHTLLSVQGWYKLLSVQCHVYDSYHCVSHHALTSRWVTVSHVLSQCVTLWHDEPCYVTVCHDEPRYVTVSHVMSRWAMLSRCHVMLRWATWCHGKPVRTVPLPWWHDPTECQYWLLMRHRLTIHTICY